MRQLLRKVLQPTENPLKLLVVGGKSFPNKLWKNIFIYIFFEKIFRENFTYLAAPYRAAAAPKGAPTHWKSTEAAGGHGRKTFSKKYEKIFHHIYFLRKFFEKDFTYLAAPYRAAAAPKGAPTHWKSTETAGGGREKFSEKLFKIIFSYIWFFWENFSRKCHLPSCSLSCGSCSQRCFNLLKIHWSCRLVRIQVFRKVIYSDIFLRKIFRENFTYLAAPYRAAAAPKGAPTHWKSTEAVGGGRKKFSEKLWKKYFQIYNFLRKFFEKISLT